MKWTDVQELVEQPSVLAAFDSYERDPGKQNAAVIVFAVVRANAARVAKIGTMTLELLVEYQPQEGPAVLLHGPTFTDQLRQAQVEARKAPGGIVAATLVCSGSPRRIATASAPLEFGTYNAGREWSKKLYDFQRQVLEDEQAARALGDRR